MPDGVSRVKAFFIIYRMAAYILPLPADFCSFSAERNWKRGQNRAERPRQRQEILRGAEEFDPASANEQVEQELCAALRRLLPGPAAGPGGGGAASGAAARRRINAKKRPLRVAFFGKNLLQFFPGWDRITWNHKRRQATGRGNTPWPCASDCTTQHSDFESHHGLVISVFPRNSKAGK